MSLGTSNRDGGKTSESGHLRALSKIVSGDVISGFSVAQRAAGSNMSVDISIGDAFVRRSDGTYAHPVFNDAVYNQVVSTADGSNPRRDIIVLYVDYGQTPSTAVSNNTNGVVKIKIVNGTPAGSPVDPTDPAIQSSVGSGNPYTKLARVRVPAGQTSISNSLIDDIRVLTTALAGSVTDASLSTKPGELNGNWADWSPTLGNLSGGTLNYAKYTKIGKTISFRFKYTLAGAGISSSVSISLPVAPEASLGGIEPFNAVCMFYDSSAGASGRYYGLVVADGSDGIVPSVINAAGTYAKRDTLASDRPFTWASGDIIFVVGSYKIA